MMAVIFLVALIFIAIPLEKVGADSKIINLKFANFFPPKAKHSKLCEEFKNWKSVRVAG